MDNSLTIDDINDQFKSKIYSQDYSDKQKIDGVTLYPLSIHVSEDGDFSELVRINDKGEIDGIPGFKLEQINRTRLINGIVKAWHIHLEQDEIWYVNPEAHLLIGLFDARKNSPTAGFVMRFIMGGGKSQLLYIPKGVAHGSANLLNEPSVIWYFINKQFSSNKPDEMRLPWDTLGANFWEPKRD